MSVKLTPAEMAKYIDHTYLKPEASVADIRRICAEAKAMNTASVCVNPSYIKLVAQELEGSDVTPCCVIGFPLGATTPNAKAFEAAEAVANGAGEVDMVINVGAVKSGDWALVERDIAAVVTAVDGEAKVKVIIEACLLTDEEKVLVCQAAKRVGLRQDLHRLLHRRRDGCRREADAADRGPRHGRQGLRRRANLRGRHCHDRGRGLPSGRLRRQGHY